MRPLAPVQLLCGASLLYQPLHPKDMSVAWSRCCLLRLCDGRQVNAIVLVDCTRNSSSRHPCSLADLLPGSEVVRKALRFLLFTKNPDKYVLPLPQCCPACTIIPTPYHALLCLRPQASAVKQQASYRILLSMC